MKKVAFLVLVASLSFLISGCNEQSSQINNEKVTEGVIIYYDSSQVAQEGKDGQIVKTDANNIMEYEGILKYLKEKKQFVRINWKYIGYSNFANKNWWAIRAIR